jgi:hypothetical protein
LFFLEEYSMLRLISNLLLTACALTLASCGGPRYVDYFPYHDNGMAKPAVALLPTLDRTHCETTEASAADDIMSEMRYQIMDSGQLYVIGSKQLDPAIACMGSIDPMGNDISYSKQFGPCEFLVVTELIDHKYVPYVKGIPFLHAFHGQYCNQVLMMKVRIRMIDLRGSKPCIVLQEIIESNHMISPINNPDGARLSGNLTAYRASPVSIAHQRIARELMERIENVAYTTR